MGAYAAHLRCVYVNKPSLRCFLLLGNCIQPTSSPFFLRLTGARNHKEPISGRSSSELEIELELELELELEFELT